MKSKMCLLLILFCAFNFGFAPCLFSQEYVVRRLTPDDGLASVQVRKIVQDKFGYIWVASRNDISRYDGYNFKTYKFDSDTLGAKYTGGVSNLKIDREGNVWVIGELLSKYDSAIDDFMHYQPNTRLDNLRFTYFETDNRTIWFGDNFDGLILFDTQTKQTRHYVNNHRDSLTNALRNSVWGISDRGTFLLLATRQGLWNFDKTKKIFSRPKCDPKDTAEFYQQPIWELIEYPHYDPDEIWLSVGGSKMVKVDRNLNIKQQFAFSSGYPFTREKTGVFWFYTNDGFWRYDPRDNSSSYLAKDFPQTRLANSVFVDREQIIWLGTETIGLYQVVPKKIQFHNFRFDSPANWVSGAVFQSNRTEHLAFVRAEGGMNDMWTAVPNLSVALDSVKFQKVATSPPLMGLIMSVTAGKNKLLMSSWNSGVMMFPIDPETGVVRSGRMFAADKSEPNHIRPWIGDAYEDYNGNVWSASRGFGVSKILNKKLYGSEGSVTHYVHNDLDSNSLSHNYSWTFYPEDEKSFWIANRNSVDLFRNGGFEHVFKHVRAPRSLLKISTDTLIIGTYNGFYEAVKANDRYILGSKFLPKYCLYSMASDDAGRLWFVDPIHSRMVCYDRKRKVAIELSTKDDLPEGVAFLSQTSKGIIILGSAGGITLFDPRDLKISLTRTFPVLTQLKVNNQISSFQKVSQASRSAMNDTNAPFQLVLDYQHNNFSLEFSAMEMTSPDKNLYRHKLEEFDKDWIETDWKNRTATYTNLDPGEYVFRVKASNHYGIWSDEETELRVVILPPPWRTWWAYSLYGLALIGVFMSWRRYDLKRVKLKHRAQHLSELDNLKTRFFTNISHEFRTPITLIQGPLKEMYDKTVNKEERSGIGIMLRNAQRLSKLINQLLDLSKLEAGKMTLHVSNVDLVQFLREIAASYESLAANKNIKYFFYPEVAELMVYIDREKMESVVHNLLSNAFKFTKGGEITLHFKPHGKQCSIQVKNTGVGIPSDQLDKIFDRFHQVDSSQTRDYEGSGLGMALAKELVELHHGTIRVESIESKGTTFTVALRLGKEHFKAHEIVEGERRNPDSSVEDTFMSVERTDQKTAGSPDQPILLIVEDNADMRHYLGKTFSDHYQIFEATNGEEGLVKSTEVVPDLIISDIMMPEMDGYKFCEHIKTNELTSHIPVILLTAKADRDSKLTGLDTGADDYLAKPFDSDELKLIVRNRIEQRRRIREKFSREISLEPKQIAITSFDERFLHKVLGIIEMHIGDENFSVDELSREAGFSNMHFYRKIKALSGETPSQFLRTIRLKRAAELLRKKSDNVTQIAYSVGFNSLPYFIKCFKEQFGKTPGQFAEEPSNDNIKNS